MTVTVKITALPIYVAAPFRVKLKSQTFTTYGLIVRKDINFSVKEFDVLYMLYSKDNIVISFDKYKSDITVSQDLIIGYVKDGIMYEGEVFDELSGKYSFSPDEKGEYFFYLLSGSSDYLSLKSGNLEVN